MGPASTNPWPSAPSPNWLLYIRLNAGSVPTTPGGTLIGSTRFAAGGAHLLVMACRAGPSGRMLGFEPRPGSLRTLHRIVALAGLSRRVRLHQVALSDRDGSQPLRIPIVPTRAHFRGTTADPDGAAAFAHLPHRSIEVPTLDGHETFKVPEGTQSGTVFRLRGKGMPDVTGRGRGDLFFTVQAVTPKKLNKEQRALLEQLSKSLPKEQYEPRPLDGEEDEKNIFEKVKDIFG